MPGPDFLRIPAPQVPWNKEHRVRCGNAPNPINQLLGTALPPIRDDPRWRPGPVPGLSNTFSGFYTTFYITFPGFYTTFPIFHITFSVSISLFIALSKRRKS